MHKICLQMRIKSIKKYKHELCKNIIMKYKIKIKWNDIKSETVSGCCHLKIIIIKIQWTRTI